MLAALKAGPKTVDLRQLASHYYDLAARVLELFEEEEIVDVLSEVRKMTALPTRGKGRELLRDAICGWISYRGLTCNGAIQTFKERAAEIADHAHNPRGALGEAQDFLRGLDEMERQCSYLNCMRYGMWC